MNKITDEEIIKAITNNKTYASTLKALNKAVNSSQYRWVKSQIKRLNLSISHFQTNSERTKQNWLDGKFNSISTKKKISDEELFSKESLVHNTKMIKKRLFEKLQCEYKCYECNISEWNKKPISLELDHINGDPLDNRIENLRILCPNCHSQTSTFRGKNNLKKTFNCLECGGAMHRNSKQCHDCYVKNLKKCSKYPDIKILEDEVKENGWRATGKKYGVSDNAIKKRLVTRGIHIKFHKQK